MSYIVIGRESCSFCKATIDLLKLKKKSYEFHEISSINKKGSLWCKKPKSHTTVPIIFYNENFIGGYTELSKLLHSE
jgi:glutaredoxin